MTTTKITRLTGANVDALVQARKAGLLTQGTEITATTATFPNNAYTASCLVRNAKTVLIQRYGHPANQHPVASLNAVIRKLQAQITPDEDDEPQKFDTDPAPFLIKKPTPQGPRQLHEIARDIDNTWKNVYFGAEPYLRAMRGLNSITDSYGWDSAKEIVLYFLSNAGSWKGDDARRIKAELRSLLKK